MENETGETGFNRPIDPLLEKIGIVGVNVAVQEQDQTVFDPINPLKLDAKALILFFVKAGDDVVVVHLTTDPPGDRKR